MPHDATPVSQVVVPIDAVWQTQHPVGAGVVAVIVVGARVAVAVDVDVEGDGGGGGPPPEHMYVIDAGSSAAQDPCDSKSAHDSPLKTIPAQSATSV